MWSQRKEFSCDPTSTTDAGRSPDSSLLTHHHPDLPACHCRVRSALLQTTRSAGCRAHSLLSAVSHQGETSFPIHLHPDRLLTPVFLYPHPQPKNRNRAHPVSSTGKKTAADLKPRGSEGVAGSASQSSSTHTLGCLVRFRTQSLGSHPTQSERHRQRSPRAVGPPRQRTEGSTDSVADQTAGTDALLLANLPAHRLAVSRRLA